MISALLESQKEERGRKRQKELMAENIPNLGRNSDIQMNAANKPFPNSSPKQSSPRHVIKLSEIKDKEKMLRAAREKKIPNTRELL